jgi:hypothetical protein
LLALILRTFCLLLTLASTPARAETSYRTPNDFPSSATWATCPVKPLAWFTKAEAWAWEQVCMDRIAYMQSVPSDDPRSDCHVPPTAASPFGRVLSARFLDVVTTQEPFISHTPGQYSAFLCAAFETKVSIVGNVPNGIVLYGAVFIDGARFAGNFGAFLALDHSISYKAIDLGAASISSYLNLNESIIIGSIKAEGIKVRRNALFQYINIISDENISEEADPYWKDDIIGDVIDWRRSQKDGRETAGLDTWAPAIFYQQDSDVAGRSAILLQDAEIGGNVALSGAWAQGRVSLLRASVKQGVYAQTSVLGNLRVAQADIGHDVALWDSVIARIDGASAKIGGDVHGQSATIFEIYMLDATVDGSVFLDSAVVYTLSLERASVVNSIHLRSSFDANLGEGRSGRFSNINLHGVKVGQHLQLQGSYIGRADLSNAQIDTLVLHQHNKFPLWSPLGRSSLNLSGAGIGTLRARFPESFISSFFPYKLGTYSSYSVFELGCSYFELPLNQTAVARDAADEDSTTVTLGDEETERSFVVKFGRASVTYSSTEPSCLLAEPVWSIDGLPINFDALKNLGSEMEQEGLILPIKYDGDDPPYISLNLDRLQYQNIDEGLNDTALLDLYRGRYNLDNLREWVGQSLSISGQKEDSDFMATYHPFAYQFLADHLRNRGINHGANTLMFDMHLERLKIYISDLSVERTGPLLQRVFRVVRDGIWMMFLGFGVYPWFALIWFFLFVLAGVGIAAARRSCPPDESGPASIAHIPWTTAYHWAEANPEQLVSEIKIEIGRKPTLWQCFWYSLENAIPLINPSEDHKKWLHKDDFARTFFHLQKIAGFVLISIFIASLSLS